MRNDAEALELFVCVKTRPRVQEQTSILILSRGTCTIENGNGHLGKKRRKHMCGYVQGLKVGPFLVAGFEF